MAAPPDGIYVIVNRVLSPDGFELAVTYNGDGKPVILTANSNSKDQQVCPLFLVSDVC
jgi:hypothetical protein